MKNTIKKILTIGTATAIIGIGGVAIAGMGGGYGSGYHMGGYGAGHMMGYGGHMMAQNTPMYGGAGNCIDDGYMYGRNGQENFRHMNQDMYRYHNQAQGFGMNQSSTLDQNTDTNQ